MCNIRRATERKEMEEEEQKFVVVEEIDQNYPDEVMYCPVHGDGCPYIARVSEHV